MTYDDDYRRTVLLDFGCAAEEFPATFQIAGSREPERATLLNVQLGGLPLSREQVRTAIGTDDLRVLEAEALAFWDEANGGYLGDYRGWGDAA